MLNLDVAGAKALLNNSDNDQTEPLVYMPKFLRSIFPPDDKGHMIIDVNVLRKKGFDESHIYKLLDVYHGNYGLVVQVFRPSQYTVINK